MPFYSRELPELARQVSPLNPHCAEYPLSECTYYDQSRIQHYYFEDLKMKIVVAADFEGRSIPAVGIGEARGRAEVLDRVSRFLEDASFDCMPQEPNDGTADESCFTLIGEGWITLYFLDGELVSIELTSSHYI